MAKFIFTATIEVDGKRIRSRSDAITELNVMINDYYENNSDGETDIVVYYSDIKKA